jgi:ATP-dependent Clp protease protease subunit
VNNGQDEVHLCLNSIGGYVGEGIYFYNHMRGLPIKIIRHNTGSLMSIAVAIFVGGEERYCSEHGVFMIHPTTLESFQEAVPWEKLDAGLKSTLADDLRTESILRERATIHDAILNDRRVRDVHITPDQALKWGMVHSVREFSLPKGNQIIQI